MKTCIYVFSGTGTSLAVARKISQVLDDVSIKLIPNVLDKAGDAGITPESPVIGLIFPNYFGGIPNIVLRFIEKLELDDTNYIFSIVTSGGGQGYSLKYLEEILHKKGKSLNYGKYLGGTSNYIVAWYYNLTCKQGEKRIKILQSIDEMIIKFTKDIAMQKNEVEHSRYLSYMISRILTPKAISEDTRCWDKEFSVGEECIGCRTCMQVCQAKNIIMVNNKPQFQHNCQRCMACIQYCPKNAIHHKGKILNKPKYFHPDFPAKEMIKFMEK